MKRIAYLAHGTGHGGAGASLILMVKSIHHLNYEKYLFVNRITYWAGIDTFFNMFKKVELIEVPSIYNDLAGGCTPLTKFREYTSKSYPKFINQLISEKIDILHINTSVFPHVHRLVKEKTNIKIITHVREVIPYYDNGEVQKYMIEQILNYSDAIICISNNEAEPFVNHKNIHIIPNPFDFSSIENTKLILRQKYGINKHTVLVGMFGQFHKMKGQLLFLNILKKTILENKIEKEVKFVLIGALFNPLWKRILKRILFKNDYGTEVLSYIKKNKLEKKVLIIPYVSNIFEYIIDLDIVVRPSLSSDPWGRDIIESMAFEKPIVATGNSEFYVSNNESGYLVNKDNIDLLALKVSNLINDESLRKRFGKKGKEIIYKKCNLENFNNQLLKVYDSIN